MVSTNYKNYDIPKADALQIQRVNMTFSELLQIDSVTASFIGVSMIVSVVVLFSLFIGGSIFFPSLMISLILLAIGLLFGTVAFTENIVHNEQVSILVIALIFSLGSIAILFITLLSQHKQRKSRRPYGGKIASY